MSVVDAQLLYENLFTGINCDSQNEIFTCAVVDEIVTIIGLINPDIEVHHAA